MNAHINHDLALALLATSEERGAMPERGGPQHRDFERVNSLLERVEAQVKAELLSRQVREVDRRFGRVDGSGSLREVSLASRKFVQNLDRLVGLSSKGLLVPTEIA